jgi:hypothetical protein
VSGAEVEAGVDFPRVIRVATIRFATPKGSTG